MLKAMETRWYPHAENWVWSVQEENEMRLSKDRASGCHEFHSDSFYDTIRCEAQTAVLQTISRRLAEANLQSKRVFYLPSLPSKLHHAKAT
ncbi:hypothetical protein TNCT_673041 [Trichonephila clavata]|uniref:Uncharacterized protein n=1 Tax=Trichonephila clavata TaxID=2740835 RepID=A0A8X6GTM7_TRICU|nr:hypothetical protein TNCT_673041 [Trichonephila clavata]